MISILIFLSTLIYHYVNTQFCQLIFLRLSPTLVRTKFVDYRRLKLMSELIICVKSILITNFKIDTTIHHP